MIFSRTARFQDRTLGIPTLRADGDSPGPTSYNPVLPSVKSTKRHLISRGDRMPGNQSNIPGPGAYYTPLSWTISSFSSVVDEGPPPVEKLPKKTPLSPKTPEAKDGTADAPEASQGRGFNDTITSSKSLRNSGVSKSSELRRCFSLIAERNDVPGPASYPLPDLWYTKDDIASRTRRGKSPRAIILWSTRTWKENLDGKKMNDIAVEPGPGTYSPAPPPPRVTGGVWSRSQRKQIVPGTTTGSSLGPGAYHRELSREAKCSINATPRRLDTLCCGIDLRKHRNLPGPGTYYPIHNDINPRTYTV